MRIDATLRISSADTPADLARLRAFVAARSAAAMGALERHLAHPRYRPAFTRIAERAGQIAGYALLDHQRLRLGAATLEAGRIAAIELTPVEQEPSQFAALLGDCLRVLVEEGLVLATLHGSVADYGSFGFAEYRFKSAVKCWNLDRVRHAVLRPVRNEDLDDLAALYEANYSQLPLTEIRTTPDWRYWLAGDQVAWALEDARRRLVAYAVMNSWAAEDSRATLYVQEAAAADAGAARALCMAVHGHSQNCEQIHMRLSPWHLVAQAALQLWSHISLTASKPSKRTPLAGVVDLPLLLEALVPEFERRMARSRYAGWSGNLRLEIDTERITLAFADGRATVIDGSRPADLRLRQITLPALAQLCLGYRVAADLRATSELACDDSALGLLDALFPAVLATGAGDVD
ncbi:MAG: sterol carrier protein domain-containing protein [Roseiflexaceae bacterium]